MSGGQLGEELFLGQARLSPLGGQAKAWGAAGVGVVPRVWVNYNRVSLCPGLASLQGQPWAAGGRSHPRERWAGQSPGQRRWNGAGVAVAGPCGSPW